MIYQHFGNAGCPPWYTRYGYHPHQQVNQRIPARYFSSERARGATGYHSVSQCSVPTYYQPCTDATSSVYQQRSNNCSSRARCSTAKQLLDPYHGVTLNSSPPPPLVSRATLSPLTLDQYSPPVTSLSWEEQFVDLSSFCTQPVLLEASPMVVSSSDEAFAVSSQPTEQRNGPDVFFGSDLAGVSMDAMDPTRGGKTGSGPGLQLNVDLTSNEPDVLSTPDVFKALDDVESFDLLDFVFSQDKKPVLFELDKANAEDLIVNDPALSLFLEKPSPSPAPSSNTLGGTSGKSFGKSLRGKTLPALPPLPVAEKKPLLDNNRNGNIQTVPPLKQIATVRPKRMKQKKLFEDFVYEGVSPGKRGNVAPLSPVQVKEEEDSDDMGSLAADLHFNFSDFNTTSGGKKKLLTLPARRRNISCSSTSSSFSSKKRRLTEEDDTIEYESGKYRELRNRNNEASRRSRANRKAREAKMKEYSDKLRADNVRLKSQSEQLELQVEKFRSCLMKIVLNGKRKTS